MAHNSPDRRPVLIMVAPTGARRTLADHPALPMTEDAIVDTALACFESGAGAIHAHVRDPEGHHLLDVETYRRLLARLAERTPGMAVQITTESASRYQPHEQAALLGTLRPRFASIAVRELFAGGEDFASGALTRAAADGVVLQYILYDDHDVERFYELSRRAAIPSGPHSIILVFGRYAVSEESDVGALTRRLATLKRVGLDRQTTWMACAFGRGETEVLEAAMAAGGHVRVGFENSLLHADGRVASNNAERVSVIAGLARKLGRPPAFGLEAEAALAGKPL